MSRISNDGSVAAPAISNASGGLASVDADKFLDLLLSELQNQDPLNPMDNAEMLQQINQIREIGATSKLTDTLSAVLLGQNVSTASSLIGKRISALTDAAKNVEGVVDRVTIEKDDANNSQPLIRVHIGDQQIDLKNIRSIADEGD